MSNPVSELLNAVAYEKFFLEQVYRLTINNGSPDIEIEISYTPDGEPLRKGRGWHIDISDWRGGFIAAGRPLIFITTFKILDSMFDWLVKTPSKPAPIQIDQKLAALEKLTPDELPELLRDEAWLFDRMVALYKRTALLRNTLIHRGEFEASAAGLHVRLGKVQAENERTAISNKEVASFAAVTITVIRLLAGVLSLDPLSRKRIRRLFDDLVSIHEQALLGQLQVKVGRVTLSFPEFRDLEFDLSRIREDISPAISLPDARGNFATLKYDVVFDIRILIGDETAGAIEEYLIPYNEVGRYPTGISTGELLACKVYRDQ